MADAKQKTGSKRSLFEVKKEIEAKKQMEKKSDFEESQDVHWIDDVFGSDGFDEDGDCVDGVEVKQRKKARGSQVRVVVKAISPRKSPRKSSKQPVQNKRCVAS